MKIFIDFIPHAQQRYDTPGDWEWKGGDLTIRVSDTGVPRFNTLIAIHEMIEALLCSLHGVDSESIDRFDMGDEWRRSGYPEPGEDPHAPYHPEHMFAECLERLVAREIGVSWKDYGECLSGLEWTPIEDPQNESPSLWSRPWFWIRGAGCPSICSVCGVEEGKPHNPLLHSEAGSTR